MSVLIYTDGACLGNPGPGGWGALLVEGDKKKEISGYVPTTTNNRMELTAVIEALCFLKTPSNVTVFTDSQYVKNGITLWMKAWEKNGWRTAQGKPVKNQDLWQRLSEEARQHHVEWCWVKGHSGHLRNERADFLATQAAKKR